MLGRLLKHELRATARTMGPLLGGLLVISALANISFRVNALERLPLIFKVVFILVLIAFVVCVAASILVTALLMVQRFRRSMFLEEGYMTHTLPVSVHALIWSKAITAMLWLTATLVCVFLCLFISVADADLIRTFFGSVWEALDGFVGSGPLTEFALSLLALMFVSTLSLILMVYAALSIGHSFSKNKAAMSVLFLFALYILDQLISRGLTTLIPDAGYGLTATLDGLAANVELWMRLWRRSWLASAGACIVEGGVYYGVGVWFLRNKLNLE